MKTALIAIALGLFVGAPTAAADCAKYASALAYNACLAAHGPKARAVHVGVAPAARGPSRRRHSFARGRRGRSSMTFSVAK
ncbi:MAG TPA: hypothetical protein VN715_12305 [Roseiarcus sp.]|nr:hypothetical protein [Roseiarcus sp.]